MSEYLGAAQLEKLLATLLEALRNAAIRLDDRLRLEISGSISHVNGEPGARACRMVIIFQYQQLLAPLDPMAGSRSE